MSKLHSLLFVPALVLAGCSVADSTNADPQPGSDDPAETPPPDGSDVTPPLVDDGYVPKPFTATRFGVFYQISGDVLDIYQDPQTGLPHVPGHAWLITHSHATAFASKALADKVHARDDFYYAPAFDLWDASHQGWQTASDAQLKTWAHDFRDAAIKGHADLFTFNECPSTTGTSANVRVKIAKILRFLHEPDAMGRQLPGVVYFTEKPSFASAWDTPAADFFKAIDETSVALVVEHYHSNSYVCSLSENALADHYFGFRQWLVDSGDAAKISIANKKYTVLHSSRFSDGPSGWAGGDATQQTLANYQRALSRIAKVTRNTEGGVNRLSFGPVTSSITDNGVQPRITALFRWHYLHTAAHGAEQSCIDNYQGNCTCQ